MGALFAAAVAVCLAGAVVGTSAAGFAAALFARVFVAAVVFAAPFSGAFLAGAFFAGSALTAAFLTAACFAGADFFFAGSVAAVSTVAGAADGCKSMLQRAGAKLTTVKLTLSPSLSTSRALRGGGSPSRRNGT